MDQLEQLARRYPVTILADPDEGFVAHIPDFPMVFTNGDTPEEALANAYEGMALALEWFQRTQTPLPEPSIVASSTT